MSDGTTTRPPQPVSLPFTLRAGDTAVRSTLAVLRVRWPWLAVPFVVAVVAGAVAGAPVDGLVSALGFLLLVLVVLGACLVCLHLYGRSTITVTPTELEVKRVRRRVLPRSELDGMVIGFFTVQPGDLIGLQAAFTTRDGGTFARVQLLYWPSEGLDQVATALGVTPRLQEDGERDRRLRPWWVRHLLATAFGIALVVVALLVAGIVVVEQRAAGARDQAARTVQRQWSAYSRSELGEGTVPGVYSSEGRARAEDDGVRLLVSVDTEVPGREVEPATLARVRSAVCGFRPDVDPEVEVLGRLSFVPAGSDDGESSRVFETSCARGDAVLEDWAAYLDAHPPAATVRRADARLPEPGTLEVSLYLTSPDPSALRSALASVCGFEPDGVELTVDALATGVQERYAGPVGCGDQQEALRQWTDQAPTS